jgi:hypothetical protein
MVTKIERAGKIKVIGIDQEHPGLVIIEVPLSVAPDNDWIECFRHPSTWTPSIHSPEVKGKSIVWRAVKETADKDIKWVFSYIDQANACYERILKEKAEQKEQEEKKRSETEKELEKIQKKLDNL